MADLHVTIEPERIVTSTLILLVVAVHDGAERRQKLVAAQVLAERPGRELDHLNPPTPHTPLTTMCEIRI